MKHRRSGCSALACGLVVAALALPALGQEQSVREIAAAAQEALAARDYERALRAYAEVGDRLPDTPEIAYNQGVAHYRLGDFDRAAELFRGALTPERPALDAWARFNLGNCAYATALRQQGSEPQAAIGSLEEALGHYCDALDLTPWDRDARANIERSQRLIEVLREQLQQQQQQQQQDQRQQEQDGQEQDQQERDQQEQQQDGQQEDQQQPQQQEPGQDQQEQQSQQPQDQPESEQQQQQGQQEQQQQQDQEQASQQQQDQADGQQPDQQAQAQPVQAGKMSRDEAERLLQAIRDKERLRRELLAKRQRAQPRPVDKDW